MMYLLLFNSSIGGWCEIPKTVPVVCEQFPVPACVYEVDAAAGLVTFEVDGELYGASCDGYNVGDNALLFFDGDAITYTVRIED